MPFPSRSRLDWVSEPPDLCILTAAISAPAAIAETEGRICSEVVMCYPPGIPVLAPGEVITADIIKYIRYAKEKGCSMTGPQDEAIENLNVIA